MVWMMTLSATVGCALWLLAYGLAWRTGEREGASAFPALAIALNISWETTWTVFRSAQGAYIEQFQFNLKIVGALWLMGNALLARQWLRYNPDASRLGVAALFAVAFAAQLAFTAATDDQSGQLTAFVVNGVDSLAFLVLLYRRPSGRGLSVGAAWAKLGGTALVMLPYLWLVPVISPGWSTYLPLHVLFVAILAADLAYAIWLTGRRARASDARSAYQTQPSS